MNDDFAKYYEFQNNWCSDLFSPPQSQDQLAINNKEKLLFFDFWLVVEK